MTKIAKKYYTNFAKRKNLNTRQIAKTRRVLLNTRPKFPEND